MTAGSGSPDGVLESGREEPQERENDVICGQGQAMRVTRRPKTHQKDFCQESKMYLSCPFLLLR
jgi:hypothetical protein